VSPDRPPVDLANRVDQIAAGRTQPSLGARQLSLDHGVVGEPAGAARGLAQCQLDKGVEHAAGDAESHTGDADRIEGLLRERIERARLAAQARVLAGAGERLGHKQTLDPVGFRRRAAQSDRVPIVEQHCFFHREEPGPHRRPAGIVEP